jgi:hypothetical protein
MASKIPAQGLFSEFLNFTGTKIILFFLTGALFKMSDNCRG